MKAGAAIVVVLLAVSGCARRGVPVSEVARPEVPVIEGAARARAACPNYERVLATSSFPRDAIVRGIESGSALVRFDVVDNRVRVLSVTSSDPTFGATALTLVRQFECRTEQPTTFEVPLSWRTAR